MLLNKDYLVGVNIYATNTEKFANMHCEELTWLYFVYHFLRARLHLYRTWWHLFYTKRLISSFYQQLLVSYKISRLISTVTLLSVAAPFCRDVLTFLTPVLLINHENQPTVLIRFHWTNVFHKGFFPWAMAVLVRISYQLPQQHKLCDTPITVNHTWVLYVLKLKEIHRETSGHSRSNLGYFGHVLEKKK